jgi:hypothetical protein
MIRRTLFCLALAGCGLVLSAQEDTVRTRKGSAPVSVRVITKDYVKVERQFPSGVKEMKIPTAEMESIRFADGFEVRFQDGKMLRDNLLSSPRILPTLWCVRVEDVIDLTREELRQYYGDRLVDLVYRPYRTQFFTGVGKIGGGLLGNYIVRKKLNPSVWTDYTRRSYGTVYSAVGESSYDYRVEYSYGDLYPGWCALQYLFLGAFTVGFLDTSASLIGMRNLARRHDSMTGPSLGWTKAEFWGGTALTVAGLGTMGVYISRLAAHRQWYSYVRIDNGTVTDDDHVGEPASEMDLVGLFLGALAVNLGASAIQVSQTRLSAFRKLDGTPYAMQVNLGPAPSGYGLTVRF